MRWLDTDLPEDALLRVDTFWTNNCEGLKNGQFWADKIMELKDDPEARLELALDNLPLPAAFREAAIATRSLIRSRRKEGLDWQPLLTQLYELAAYESMMLEYAPRLQQPGYNVMESIPGKLITGLEFSYNTLGYQELRLLNKTDIKWFVESWGEPSHHSTLNAMHKLTWDRFEDSLIKRRKEDSDRRMAAFLALRDLSNLPPTPEPEKSKWWKFW